MRILPPNTSKKSRMDSFEFILFIIYSVLYCVRDTQGILTHQIIYLTGYFLLQAWNYVRVSI